MLVDAEPAVDADRFASTAGSVSFWLTLVLVLLAACVFLGCVFCHSKEAKAGMTLAAAGTTLAKAACRGVLTFVLSCLLLCTSSSEATRVCPTQGAQPAEPPFTRLVEETADDEDGASGRMEQLHSDEKVVVAQESAAEEDAATVEVLAEEAVAAVAAGAIEANVKAFRSSIIGGKEVVEYRVQACSNDVSTARNLHPPLRAHLWPALGLGLTNPNPDPNPNPP